jgi:hypothetical protein
MGSYFGYSLAVGDINNDKYTLFLTFPLTKKLHNICSSSGWMISLLEPHYSPISRPMIIPLKRAAFTSFIKKLRLVQSALKRCILVGKI